jgi:membrane-associated phospholipid phosphatase
MTQTAPTATRAVDHRPRGGGRLRAVGRWVAPLIPMLAVLYGVMLGLGYLLANPLKGSGLEDAEDKVNENLASGRTPTMNTVTHYLTLLGETITIIALMVVVAIVLRLVLGRWRESVFVVIAVSCQALIFLLTTLVINRHRPDVKHLDASPPTSSFPSGHVGAATALYMSVALVLLWTVKHRALKWLGIVLLIACPVMVAYARLYRGMHHPTDEFGSEVNAWACIAIAAFATATARWRKLTRPSDAAAEKTA